MLKKQEKDFQYFSFQKQPPISIHRSVYLRRVIVTENVLWMININNFPTYFLANWVAAKEIRIAPMGLQTPPPYLPSKFDDETALIGELPIKIDSRKQNTTTPIWYSLLEKRINIGPSVCGRSLVFCHDQSYNLLKTPCGYRRR